MRHRGELRGNSYDRRARKKWLLEQFGNARTCECLYCGTKLDFESLTVERLTPGYDGGRYTHDNIVPACYSCNLDREEAELGFTPPYLPYVKSRRNGPKPT